jgi:hypothetical protein
MQAPENVTRRINTALRRERKQKARERKAWREGKEGKEGKERKEGGTLMGTPSGLGRYRKGTKGTGIGMEMEQKEVQMGERREEQNDQDGEDDEEEWIAGAAYGQVVVRMFDHGMVVVGILR